MASEWRVGPDGFLRHSAEEERGGGGHTVTLHLRGSGSGSSGGGGGGVGGGGGSGGGSGGGGREGAHGEASTSDGAGQRESTTTTTATAADQLCECAVLRHESTTVVLLLRPGLHADKNLRTKLASIAAPRLAQLHPQLAGATTRPLLSST